MRFRTAALSDERKHCFTPTMTIAQMLGAGDDSMSDSVMLHFPDYTESWVLNASGTGQLLFFAAKFRSQSKAIVASDQSTEHAECRTCHPSSFVKHLQHRRP